MYSTLGHTDRLVSYLLAQVFYLYLFFFISARFNVNLAFSEQLIHFINLWYSDNSRKYSSNIVPIPLKLEDYQKTYITHLFRSVRLINTNPTSVEPPEPEKQFYTAKKGDYLSQIAKEVYGKTNTYDIIFEANKPMLKNANLIYTGQVLVIPPLN